MNLTKVTRVEIIDDLGRSYVAQGVTNLDCILQDEDRTLKIFLKCSGKPTYNWVTGEVYESKE